MESIHKGPVMRIADAFFVVEQVTKQLAGELKRYNVHVTAVQCCLNENNVI